ncbi:MAG: nitrogen fixation negative regulator NifL [Thiotrichales bacterium]
MASSPSARSKKQVIDAISSFLKSPPEGTPQEILEAFNAMGAAQVLPPKVFLETVEQAPIAISITDIEAGILYANSAFEKLTGYSRQEVLGKNESVLSSKATPVEVYKDLWQTISEKKVWRGKLVNHRKNKQEYLAELTISPVLDSQGEITYFLGMHRDVTKMHRLEQRLKFQRSLTEGALDAAPMVVAMIGTDNNVILDNQAYKALHGDFRGQEPAHLFLDALSQETGFDIRDVCERGKGYTNVEVRLDPPHGPTPRWFICSGVRVDELDDAAESFFKSPENTRCCLLLIANEITESRNRINEARLNLIRASMTELQMVQTMREAISGAMFKLQVPLNIIKAALGMPENRGDTRALRDVLKQALDSGDEAMESLHAALPKPAMEESSSINLNEVLHEVLRLSTDQLLVSGVTVDWRPTAVLPVVQGRVNSLRGMFNYILDNAIQAVMESGSDFREIRVETRAEGEDVLVSIMDNGVGVPEPMRIKAFEPFYCGWAQSRRHAGMGLTMAQEVALSHGGNVEIDPHFLSGCRVFIRLPAAAQGSV